MDGEPGASATLGGDARRVRPDIPLHARPYLGRIGIDALTKTQVSEALETVRIASTNVERGFRGTQATKALKLIHAMCEFAVDKEITDRNPARGLKLPVPSRTRTLATSATY